MSEVKSAMPGICPGCNSVNFTEDWIFCSEGHEHESGSKYSISKGIAGGLLFGQVGTLAGFSHSKGSLKSTRTDIYKCKHCGYTHLRKVQTFW